MEIKNAYDIWAAQYDTNHNRTRDLEGVAMRGTLKDLEYDRCLEIGCGTGKNTIWLAENSGYLTAADFSEEMLLKARQKIAAGKVEFIQTDVTLKWPFQKNFYDLVTFSLVLEHIEDLEHAFYEASLCLKAGGLLYMGELHPFKQYKGTKARFDTAEGRQEVNCFTHNISDFINAAKKAGFNLVELNEYFDNDTVAVPRILVLLFMKKE